MKKIIAIMVLVLALGQTSVYAFNWSSLLSGMPLQNRATAQTTTSADVLKALANFQSQAQSVDNSVQNSFLSVVSKISTPQEATILNSKVASILSNNTQTQEQKNVLINQLMANYTANMNNNKTDIIEILENMSTSDRAELTSSLSDLAQNSKQYTQLAKQGVSTAQTLMRASQNANDVITSINTIRQTAANIKNRAATVTSFVNRVRSISKYAGLFIQ
jgi:formate dehydrogenase maturation protein FdhE